MVDDEFMGLRAVLAPPGIDLGRSRLSVSQRTAASLGLQSRTGDNRLVLSQISAEQLAKLFRRASDHFLAFLLETRHQLGIFQAFFDGSVELRRNVQRQIRWTYDPIPPLMA